MDKDLEWICTQLEANFIEFIEDDYEMLYWGKFIPLHPESRTGSIKKMPHSTASSHRGFIGFIYDNLGDLEININPILAREFDYKGDLEIPQVVKPIGFIYKETE